MEIYQEVQRTAVHKGQFDPLNQDGAWGQTATPFSWERVPLTAKAKKAVKYFDDSAFIFYYMGRYVVTDESLWLGEGGDGKESPFGGQRFDSESLDEVVEWLEQVWEDLQE